MEVATAKKILKARKLNGAYWRYLKRCFGSWNCLEKNESKVAKWCIRTLFDEYGRRLSGELAIACRNMLTTETTLNKTIRYNVKLLASRCLFITFNIRFLSTPVHLQTLNDMTYNLTCIFVSLCTQSVYFIRAVVMAVTSLTYMIHDIWGTTYMYMISPFDRLLLFFNCNLQHISKTRLHTG